MTESITCPYCDSSELDCKHVLLHVDQSFTECLSGWLMEDDPVLEVLREVIYAHIVNGKNPGFKSVYLNEIYNYAIENFMEDSNEEDLEIDFTAYYNFMEEETYEYGTETERYYSEGGPRMSSVYDVIFCKDCESTIQRIVQEISTSKM